MRALIDLLADDDTVASVVCQAASQLLGDGWMLWEPETVWLELKHEGCDVPIGNRQQLMAARGLLIHGRYFYDGPVFDRTCAAFSNEVLDIDGFDDTLVMHMAWGVDEAKRISALFNDTYVQMDREPVELVALQLVEEGFVLAPEELAFAQDALDRRWGSSASELKNEVRELWADLGSFDLRNVPYPETPKGVQLARLASVAEFLSERRKVRRAQEAKL